MDSSFTKSIEIESLHAPVTATSRWRMLRVMVELRRMSAVLGFAAGFVGVLLALNYSGISTLAPGDDVARAYPNPAPNAATPAYVAAEAARPAPPLFPNPRHQ